MKESLQSNRFRFLIAVLLILVATWYIFRPLGIKEDDGPYSPLFIGYRSQVVRVDSRNLSELADLAYKNGFTVEVGDRYNDDEYYEIDSFLGGGRFALSYGIGTDSTQYNFIYLSNETGRLNQFWDRFGYYFNLSESELSVIENGVRYDEDSRGKHFGGMIDGKPVWDRVVEDAGDETLRDTSMVGVLDIRYDSGGRLWLRTKYLQISQVFRYEGLEIECLVVVDGDSDVKLCVECDEELDNPNELFRSMFTALGISDSILDDFIFEENYALYI
ncbi:hypothetical protein E4H04_09885 [Candidatus Bathyarchaeota archaeon]|nr:MAG: hypothetical protein E4H04_09885 [Candidatus Bathyarchaeota archaeon]